MSVKHVKDIPAQAVKAGELTSLQVLISAQEGPNFAMRRFVMETGGGMPKHTNTVEHEQVTPWSESMMKRLMFMPGTWFSSRKGCRTGIGMSGRKILSSCASSRIKQMLSLWWMRKIANA
jgi:hypothetical protein